MITVIMPETT